MAKFMMGSIIARKKEEGEAERKKGKEDKIKHSIHNFQLRKKRPKYVEVLKTTTRNT